MKWLKNRPASVRSRTKISYMDSISHSKLDKTKQRNLLKIVQCENILFKLVKKTIEFFLHYWVVQYCTSEKSFRMLQVFAKKNDDARKFIKNQNSLACIFGSIHLYHLILDSCGSDSFISFLSHYSKFVVSRPIFFPQSTAYRHLMYTE